MKTSYVQIRVTDDMKERLQAIADQRGETISLIVRDIIRQVLTTEKNSDAMHEKTVEYRAKNRKK